MKLQGIKVLAQVVVVVKLDCSKHPIPQIPGYRHHFKAFVGGESRFSYTLHSGTGAPSTGWLSPLLGPCPALHHPGHGERERRWRKLTGSQPAWLAGPQLTTVHRWLMKSIMQPQLDPSQAGMFSLHGSRKWHIMWVQVSNDSHMLAYTHTSPTHHAHTHITQAHTPSTDTCLLHLDIIWTLSLFLAEFALPSAWICPLGGPKLPQAGPCVEAAGKTWWSCLFISVTFHLQKFSLLQQPQSQSNLMIWFLGDSLILVDWIWNVPFKTIPLSNLFDH